MKMVAAKCQTEGCNGSILSKLILILTVSFILQHHQVQAGGGKPCSLRILSEGKLLNDSGLCLEEFVTEDCLNFKASFNKSYLPDVFDRDGLSIQKPDNMELEPLLSPWKDRIYPGVRVIWKPPYSESAKDVLDGYYLELHDETKNKQNLCRMFKLNSSSPLRHKNLQFQYDVNYVATKSNLVVKVFSLPPPPPQSKDDERSFVHMLMQSGVDYKKYENPGYWVPSLAMKTWNNGTINVKFTLSPPDLNLTDYTVMLVSLSKDPENPYLETKITDAPSYTPEQPQGSVFFNNLESDEYQIVLWVEDKYHKESGKCQCWIWENGSKYCQNICGGTRSQAFYLNVTDSANTLDSTTSKETITTEEEESYTPTAEASTAEMGNKFNTYEIVLIVAGIIAVVVALLLILLFVNRHQLRGKHLAKFFCTRCIDGKSSFYLGNAENGRSTTSSKEGSHLKNKTVYMMASSDHEAHTCLVDSFAQFLKVHCSCDVLYYPWDDEHLAGNYGWFVTNINKADYIICVDSEGAAKLWHNHINGTHENIKMSAEDVLYDFGIKHIVSNQNNNCRADNLVHVCFGEDKCSSYLPSTTVYRLPECLPQFLYRLHGPTFREIRSTFYQTCTENLGELPEGANLVAAIESSAAYEKNHPDWAKKRFGKPKPKLQKPVSIDSGINMPYNQMLSVSSQDLSQFSANTPSPDSNPDQPEFPSVAKYPYKAIGDPQLSFYTLRSDFQSEVSQVKEVPSTRQEGYGVRRELEEHRQNAPVYYKGMKIVPPESVSEIVCSDTVSTALRNINRQNQDANSCFTLAQPIAEEDQEFETPTASSQQIQVSKEEFQSKIKPPDTFSDFQMESLSAAFGEINEDSDVAFMTGGRLELQDQDLGSISYI